MRTEYRYTLTRSRDEGEGVVCWVCLNPSSVPDHKETPTRLRIQQVSWREGFSSLILVNRYAVATPYSRLLYRHEHPQGDKNNFHVEQAIKNSDEVIFAWGGFGFWKTAEPPTDAERYALQWDKKPMCLGLTMAGQPRHPLYADLKKPPQPYWRD